MVPISDLIHCGAMGAKMFKTRATHSRGLLRSMLCLAPALAAIPAGTARAAELCADMDILVREAHSNFSNWTTRTTEAAIPLMLPRADDCAVAWSLSGVKVYHCTWMFAYRTDGAYGTFDSFDRSLRECFGERAHLSRDQSVNHPDFYDLRRYQLGQVNVTLSIKDKGALQSTHVFVRVQGVKLD